MSCWSSTTTTSSTRRDIHEALAFLLEHLPPQMHLVIATRADPPLPLARLRARGELAEIRAADLRFTPPKPPRSSTRRWGSASRQHDVAALEARTEGWIAACSWPRSRCRGETTSPGSSRGFAGDDRYIVDYLVEEVLQRQPEGVRSFLLQTSILDRLSGPLCDAVTGQDDGKAMLEALERGNLFVVPLDDRRHWYRYHHLFADVLRAHLLAEQPERRPRAAPAGERVVRAERRAAEAIRHALAAEDFARAADLVELAGPAMRQESTGGDAARLAEGAARRGDPPGPCSASRMPGRCCRAASSRASRPACGTPSGGWTIGRHRARTGPPAGMVVVDERSSAVSRGRSPCTAPALALAWATWPAHALRPAGARPRPRGRPSRRGGGGGAPGARSWTSGDLEAAYRTYAEGMAAAEGRGHPDPSAAPSPWRISGWRKVVSARRMRTYEQALQLAAEQARRPCCGERRTCTWA